MDKILSIVWYKVLPPVFGGQKGIAGFNHQVSQHHELVCLCSKDNQPAGDPGYRILPELPVGKFQFINPAIWSKIDSVAKKERPSFIIIEHPYHGKAGQMARKNSSAKFIIHSHNIESERFRQLGRWWWRLLRRYEKWVHRKADLSIFKTEEDKAFAISQFALDRDKCIVVPYGIHKPLVGENAAQLIRQRHNIAEKERILLFAGTLDYKPNAVAVKNIYFKIVAGLQSTGIPFKIIICGKPCHAYKPWHGSHPSILQVGEVEDIENYFQAADVFINPVTFGGGMQTKNVEALANHCNVVCFSHMATGLPAALCGNKLGLVRKDDWNGFINSILKALEQKEKTPDSFFVYFDPENCIKPLLDRLKSL